MQASDPRALSLVIYHKLARDLPALDDDPSPQALTRLLLDAINLLPEFEAEIDSPANRIRVRRNPGEEETEFTINIQSALDSLRTLWNEYRRFAAQDAVQED